MLFEWKSALNLSKRATERYGEKKSIVLLSQIANQIKENNLDNLISGVSKAIQELS